MFNPSFQDEFSRARTPRNEGFSGHSGTARTIEDVVGTRAFIMFEQPRAWSTARLTVARDPDAVVSFVARAQKVQTAGSARIITLCGQSGPFCPIFQGVRSVTPDQRKRSNVAESVNCGFPGHGS